MNLQEIQVAITNLSDSDYKSLMEWLTNHDFDRWDNQIEQDSASGRLDSWLNEARQQQAQGKTTPL